MGILSTLWGSNIRFNPRPWKNQKPTVEEINTQPFVNTTMIEDKTFDDLHMKVVERVDALINTKEEGFENWGQNTKKFEGTVLKK